MQSVHPRSGSCCVRQKEQDQTKARIQLFEAVAVVLGFHSCQLLTSPAFSCVSGVRKKVQRTQKKYSSQKCKDLTEGCFPGSLFVFHTYGPLNLLPKDLAWVSRANGHVDWGQLEMPPIISLSPGPSCGTCCCSIRTNPKLLQVCTSHAL